MDAARYKTPAEWLAWEKSAETPADEPNLQALLKAIEELRAWKQCRERAPAEA